MKIIAIFPNGYKDTMAGLIFDGLSNTKINLDLIVYDYLNKKFTEDEIVEHSKDADYIFVFWCKYQSKYAGSEYPLDIMDKINKPEITAYIDGSEYNCTGYPNPKNQAELSKKDTRLCKGEPWINEEVYNRCQWYFKRETYKEDLNRDKIIPLLVGAKSGYDKLEEKWWSKKNHDIFCSFGHTGTGLRLEVQNVCENLKKQGFNVIIGSNFPYDEYLQYIIDSHIGVSSWGAGNSCRRMWEIMSNKTCCFVQKKEILFPNIFEDGVSYVEYQTPEEFEEKARYYIKNKDECIKIGIKGYEHIKKYHTGVKRLEYMINVMNGKNWQTALI
tara:strand:- start:3193 stop:4179 length:987 start_codon:yes stop_codon:yes gene_type:complete